MTQSSSEPPWPVPTGSPVAGVAPPERFVDGSEVPFAPESPLPIEGDGHRFFPASQRWGMWDIAIGVPFIIAGAIAGMAAGLLINGSTDLSESLTAPAVVACGALGQQLGMAAWPLIVSRWKGLGPVRDWGFRFTWADLAIGPGLGLLMSFAGIAVSYALASALGVLESDDLSNTSILTDNRGSVWFGVIVFVTVVGAPLSEELYFRGLAFRSIEKRFGWTSALLGSSLLFVLPHFTGADWRETVVLLGTLSVVSVSLVMILRLTNRLGTPILAHATFNGLSVLALIAAT